MEEGLDSEGLEPVKEGLETVVTRIALRMQLKIDQPELLESMELLDPLKELPALFKVKATDVKVVQRVADFWLDYSKYLSTTGPMASPVVQLNMERMPAAEFWALHLGHLRAASPIAKVVLSQGACASQAERNWKMYGRIMTPERSAMSHEKADKRVFLYNYLQQEDRVADANFAAPLIEWDDASSSDEGEAV